MLIILIKATGRSIRVRNHALSSVSVGESDDASTLQMPLRNRIRCRDGYPLGVYGLRLSSTQVNSRSLASTQEQLKHSANSLVNQLASRLTKENN